MKNKFEILVDAEDCIEKDLRQITDVPENILCIGNRWNGEPIYIAIANAYPYDHIGQIWLTSNDIINCKGTSGQTFTLVCKIKNEWVDISSGKMPMNAVLGGKSEDDNDIYVARLKRGCNIIPGEFTPALGIATVFHEGNKIRSSYCQVLIGGSSNYSWVTAQSGEIADYAVVAAKAKNNELMYIGRINKTLGYIIHSEALRYQMAYDVLVEDEKWYYHS